jgi:CheY-like chemotaxis protein
MSLPFHFEHLVGIREQARVLATRTRVHEDDLRALVTTADMHVRHAEAAFWDALDATHESVEHLHALLSAEVRRSQVSADTARQLWAGAHEQHAAAGMLLAEIDHDVAAGMDRGPRRRDAVLVVDDHDQIRDVIAELLRDAGFVVRTAANGLEALLAAYEMQPAVIVMDVAMPVLDGIEATRLIKAMETTRQARVIAYTGNAVGGHLAPTLFAAVVQKPASPEALLATVQHVASL